jgi:hypothetical protein
MKGKILNVLLILTSLVGYLEWGRNNHLFLFQAELEIISKLITAPASVMHPFVLIPLVGQMLLLFTLLQQKPNRALTHIGLACLGILLAFMFIIGIIGLNYKIFLSSIPFILTAIYTVLYHKKQNITR